MNPFEQGCVVLQEGAGGAAGLTFKPDTNSEIGCLYSTMLWARTERGGGIAIEFTHHAVTLEGRGLESLVSQLCQQKVVSIRVASRAEIGLEGEGPVVTEIVIKEK